MDEDFKDNYSIGRTDVLEYLESYRRIEQRSLQIQLLSTEIIAPIGLFINIVFLYTVMRVKSMHTITNIYLSNLAVADSLWLLSCLVFSILSPLEYTLLLNQAITSIQSMLQAASNFFVVVIAAERFSAVHHPLTFREKASKSRAVKISAGLWVLIVTTGVTFTFLPISKDFFFEIILWTEFIISIVCLTVTLALYIYIVAKICNQTTKLPKHPKKAGKVLRMVIINTAIFFTLNSLDTTFAIIFLVAKNYNIDIPSQALEALKLLTTLQIMVACSAILQVISSSIDPLVYSATNSDYRTAVVQAFSFLKLCCPCCPRQNPSQPSQPRKQIDLHVIPQPQNDQRHHAVRPSSSSKPPSQGLAQHTQSQQPLHSCQQQCSRPSSSKASMHSQQHGLVHAHVHAEPAGIPALASSHQEQNAPV